jgi:hypothetical protein
MSGPAKLSIDFLKHDCPGKVQRGKAHVGVGHAAVRSASSLPSLPSIHEAGAGRSATRGVFRT